MVFISRKVGFFYFFCAIIVLIVAFLSLFFSSYAFSPVPLEVSERVLENIIRLDGVLFGFTAVMTSLIYREEKFRGKKFLTLMVWSSVSFLCYLLAIFMSFCFLMSQTRDYQIFVPVILTCFGGLCSSIYMILTAIEPNKKE